MCGRLLVSCLERNTTIIRLQLSVTDDIELGELTAVSAILQRNKDMLVAREAEEEQALRLRLLTLEHEKAVRRACRNCLCL